MENLLDQGKILLRDEDIPNVTNNLLPAHNNGPIVGMICEDEEVDPAIKAIIAIADTEKGPRVTPEQEKGISDVFKQAFMVWGTIKQPRPNEPVFVGRIPQKPMTDPSTVPWNYQ